MNSSPLAYNLLSSDTLLSNEQCEEVFKILLNSLFTSSRETKSETSLEHLQLNTDIVIALTSWFNQPANTFSLSPLIRPRVVFENYFQQSQKKRLWYIVKTIEASYLFGYNITSKYTLYIYTTPNSTNHTPTILDLASFKCSSCGQFISLQHACYHLLALYISISPDSCVPPPSSLSVTDIKQIKFI